MNATISTWRRSALRNIWLIGAACALLPAPVLAQQDNVEVSDHGRVTLTVKDTDLAQVLEMLAIQSRKNIIASNQVSGTISANLYDVTFYEALDAILRVNGYGYIEEGNFIYVYTGEEMTQIQQARRKLESRVFELEYLAAGDAYEFILPLLSENGRASFRGDVAPGFKPDVNDGGADTYAFTPKLVVNDYPENIEAVATTLAELDSPPAQVLVESTILQTQLDERNAFGVDFSLIGSINFTDLTRPLASVNNLLAGSDATEGFQPADNSGFGAATSVGGTAGEAGLKIGVINEDFAVFMKVLDDVTDTTVLARPKIMCLNRQRAEILVGARVGFLSTTATETSTTQSVEFLDTGIQLVFRPFVSRNGMIRLELAPSVSEASLRSVTDANGLIVTIPDELTNELTTNVRVPDGQTLVLGGLFRESNRRNRRQVPVLGEVPLLGAAFRGQEDFVDRDEIIFLITPSIVEDELAAGFGAEVLDYVDAARVGARAGLLPFSREKLTNGYNKNAVAAHARGDVEEALYYVNCSLRLKPSQPEMVRFREQITGSEVVPHEGSVLERVIRRELGPLSSANPRDEAPFMMPEAPPAHLSVETIRPAVAAAPSSPQHWSSWQNANPQHWSKWQAQHGGTTAPHGVAEGDQAAGSDQAAEDWDLWDEQWQSWQSSPDSQGWNEWSDQQQEPAAPAPAQPELQQVAIAPPAKRTPVAVQPKPAAPAQPSASVQNSNAALDERLIFDELLRSFFEELDLPMPPAEPAAWQSSADVEPEIVDFPFSTFDDVAPEAVVGADEDQENPQH